MSVLAASTSPAMDGARVAEGSNEPLRVGTRALLWALVVVLSGDSLMP